LLFAPNTMMFLHLYLFRDMESLYLPFAVRPCPFPRAFEDVSIALFPPFLCQNGGLFSPRFFSTLDYTHDLNSPHIKPYSLTALRGLGLPFGFPLSFLLYGPRGGRSLRGGRSGLSSVEIRASCRPYYSPMWNVKLLIKEMFLFFFPCLLWVLYVVSVFLGLFSNGFGALGAGLFPPLPAAFSSLADFHASLHGASLFPPFFFSPLCLFIDVIFQSRRPTSFF